MEERVRSATSSVLNWAFWLIDLSQDEQNVTNAQEREKISFALRSRAHMQRSRKSGHRTREAQFRNETMCRMQSSVTLCDFKPCRSL
jgi:hypothetical protein